MKTDERDGMTGAYTVPLLHQPLPAETLDKWKWKQRVRRLICLSFVVLELAFLLACLLLSWYHFHAVTSSSLWLACEEKGKDGYAFCDTSLPEAQRLKDLISRVSVADAGGELTARQSKALPEIGLPAYYWGTNAIHGLQNVDCLPNGICATAFPAPINLAASFDMSLVYDMGRIIGEELRAYFNEKLHDSLDTWSPTINIHRDPRWGRNVESPGEDPLLAGLYGAAYTRGLQEGPEYPKVAKAVVTLKHWFAYSMENYGGVTRYGFNAQVSAYDLGATYLVPWEIVIKEAKPLGIMCSYNAVNGRPTCANPNGVKILRDWGFDGYITSDTDSCWNIYRPHRYKPTPEEAVQACLEGDTHINSGVTYAKHLAAAVQSGVVNRSLVDHALYKAFEARMRLGLFDKKGGKQTSYDTITTSVVGSPDHIASSVLAARKSMILLKNDNNILPLSKGKRVAVIGQSSNGTGDILGNYNGQICADKTFSCVRTMYQEIRDTNEGGTTTLNPHVKDVSAAVHAAENADYVVLTVSNFHTSGGEGLDVKSVAVESTQQALLQAVAKVGKPTVLVVIDAGAISLDDNVGLFPGIIQAYSPGVHGAIAVAETLFGENNPGGKMPVTMYHSSYVNEVDFLDMSMTAGPGRTYRYYTGKPTIPFGFGLSYTTFEMAWRSKPQCSFQGDLEEKCIFVVEVKNTGKVKGDEVVQVYMRPREDSLLHLAQPAPVPRKQLLDFKRVSIEAGSSELVTVPLKAKQLGLVDSHGNRKLQPGSYDIVFSRGHGVELVMFLQVTTDLPILIQEFRHKWW